MKRTSVMSRFRGLVLAMAALASIAHAQRVPRIGYVYPAGGQQGQTFEVTLGGQNLTGASEVYFSGRGIEAKVISHQRPLNGKETEFLRERLAQLEEDRKSASTSASKTAAAPDREIAEIQEKLANFGNGRPFNVAIAENVTLQVTMAPDATLGQQEIRVATPSGLSNPLVFFVGQLPEFSEPPAKGSLKMEIDTSPRGQKKRRPKEELPVVTLPAVINGQILAGEVDRLRFTARRGQRVVVAVNARKLIPYLPDAVPGWFQAAITLTDASGRELAYADDFSFEPDPVLCYTMPKDGEYVIEIHDSLYRGREDFVYRVTVGELPFITSISPLGGAAGSQCNVQLRGWNLAAETIALDLRNAKPGFLPIVATSGMKVSNFMQFAVDALPEISEREPNNAPNAALPITVPIIINGRIDQPGDTDIFRIEGRAGSEIVAEIHARRLNSPLDSALRLTDITGRQLAFNDDHEDKGAGLTTHHADSRLTATLPRDGVYFLHVADAQHAGGPDYSYRLRVSAPRPDFALRVVPSSISGRAGAKVPITVHAMRKDGFTGEIAIALKDAPKGFVLTGGNVPAEKGEAKLTITLPEALDEPLALELEGRAKIDGVEVAHRAVPADEMQQAFAYHHLVPSKQLIVWASGRLAASGSMKIVTALPVKLTAGSTARVKIAAPFGEDGPQIQIAPIDLPAGIHVKTIAITPDGAEIEVAAEAGRVAPGENGKLTLHAFATRAGNTGKSRRIPLGALPAIAFEVAGK